MKIEETDSERELREHQEELQCYLDANPDLKRHIQQVHEWVDEHVEKHPICSSISLFDFHQSESGGAELGGFRIKFDDFESRCRISFSEEHGKLRMWRPMFHSPLGAPASFSAMQIDDNEERAINVALNKIFQLSGRDEKRIFQPDYYVTITIDTLFIGEVLGC